MKVTFQSKKYAPENVIKRSIRASAIKGEPYVWVEIDKKSWTIRQGTTTRSEIPDSVAREADKWRGQAFSFVDFPFPKTKP